MDINKKMMNGKHFSMFQTMVKTQETFRRKII